MGLGGNFESEVNLVDGVLQVLGRSSRLGGGKLVSRHVGLQQTRPGHPTQFIEGVAKLGTKWEAKLDPQEVKRLSAKEARPIEAPVFVTDCPALAIGTETHFTPYPPVDGAAASFVTLTWSEVVTIVGRTEFAAVEP